MARSCDKRNSWNFYNLIRKLDVLCLDVRIENDNFQQKMVYKFIKSTTRLNICDWSKHFVQQLADSENQRKHQSYVLLFLCEGDPLLTGGFPHKQQVIQKAFPLPHAVLLVGVLFCLYLYLTTLHLMTFVDANVEWNIVFWFQPQTLNKGFQLIITNPMKMPDCESQFSVRMFSTFDFFAQLSHCCNTKIWHT